MEVYYNEGCHHEHHNEILILGEGNFSFAKEFALSCTTQQTIYATSYDSQETVHKNQFAKENVETLDSRKNVKVKHGIDATDLSRSFQDRYFSKIIFNFPHVGGKSNIKKCRQLLKNFFISASKHVCQEGRILVALCQGQGGTPIDADRGGYGNTWQVVSQAEFSGFHLKNIQPFHFGKLKQYKQAGYRGQIGSGFLARGGFIHVFAIGRKCIFPKHFFSLGGEDQSEDLENDAQYFQNHLKHSKAVFETLKSLLHSLLSEKLTNFKNESPDFTTNSHVNQIYTDNEGIVWSKQLTGVMVNQISQTFKSSFHFPLNLVDMATPINPLMSGISQNAVYVTKGNCDTDDVIDHVFNNFDYQTIDCHDDFVKLDPSCSMGSNPIYPNWKTKEDDESLESFDINKVPAFIEQLPAKYWRAFEPECVISSEDEKKTVNYRNVPCHEYNLNSLEEQYFGQKYHHISSSEEKFSQRKVLIKGHCVLTIVQDNDQHITMFIFHLDQMLLACYRVFDIRWLYTEDERFQGQLLDEINKDFANHKISVSKRDYTMTIRFSLCHRHDLCFWLDEKHTERELSSSIRSVCGNYIHSVRLIKILKHKESSSMVSFCYRLIYNRLDGPFHHETCVKMQNELRLHLLKLGYSLR